MGRGRWPKVARQRLPPVTIDELTSFRFTHYEGRPIEEATAIEPDEMAQAVLYHARHTARTRGVVGLDDEQLVDFLELAEGMDLAAAYTAALMFRP